MDRQQPLSAKLGEIKYRQKLLKQHQEDKVFYPGQPSTKEILTILEERANRSLAIFKKLEKRGVPLSPFLELGGERCERSAVLTSKMGCQGVVVDLSAESLESASRFCPKIGLKKLPFRICADAYHLPFATNSLAFVFTFQTLHHFPDPQPVVKEIRRIISPGGHFYFDEEPVKQVLNIPLWHRDWHLTWWEKILKTLLILPFVSTVGKSELSEGALEEAFDLATWEKAINQFSRVEAKLASFPFGPSVKLKKRDKGWLKPNFGLKIMINLLGVGITALCQKKGQFKPEKTDLFQLLACPDCQKKLKKGKIYLQCPGCGQKFPVKNDILYLLPQSLRKKLYSHLPLAKKVEKDSLPPVSIIAVNWNGGKEPLEFIDSVRKLNYPSEKMEIIIIDNASQDGSPEAIKKKYPDVNLIRLRENVGYAPALNKGLKKAKGEFIFIGNNDLTMEKNSLAHLIAYAQNHPEVGIIGGKIFYKNKPKKIATCGQKYNFYTGWVSNYPRPDEEKEVPWVQGCALFFPRQLIKKIGLFDESFAKLYFEDFDLCLRAKKESYKVVYLPEAIFYHGQSTTMDKIPTPEKWHQWYKSKFRFIFKQVSPLQIVSSLSLQFLVFTPYKAFILRDKSFFPAIKGLLWNLKHLKEIIDDRKKQKN